MESQSSMPSNDTLRRTSISRLSRNRLGTKRSGSVGSMQPCLSERTMGQGRRALIVTTSRGHGLAVPATEEGVGRAQSDPCKPSSILQMPSLVAVTCTCRLHGQGTCMDGAA